MKKFIKNENGAVLLVSLILFSSIFFAINLVVTQSVGAINYEADLDTVDWNKTFHLDSPTLVDYLLFIPRVIYYGVGAFFQWATLDYTIINSLGFIGELIRYIYGTMFAIACVTAILKV